MFIVYTVEEANRLGLCRSRLVTTCPWHALAELLVKAHNPEGFPPGVRVRDGELNLEMRGESKLGDETWLDLTCNIFWQGEPVRGLLIRSEESATEIEASYATFSSAVYRTPSYAMAVGKMVDRMFKYTNGNLAVAYVLTQFAGKDPYHTFWQSRMRGRGLSM